MINDIIKRATEEFDKKFVVLKSGQLLVNEDYENIELEKGYKVIHPRDNIKAVKSFLSRTIRSTIAEAFKATEVDKPESWDKMTIERQIGFNAALAEVKRKRDLFLGL